jgi:hypothetical protein
VLVLSYNLPVQGDYVRLLGTVDNTMVSDERYMIYLFRIGYSNAPGSLSPPARGSKPAARGQ